MQQNHFKFANVDTVLLAEKYGTPLYVMSEDKIFEKTSQIKKHFLQKYEGTRAFYASKAFLSLRMCKIMKSEGIGLDAVSAGEIYTAVKAGMDPRNIVFHGNNKTNAEISYALDKGVGYIVVDSLSEIEILDLIAEKMDKQVDVLVRINPSTKPDTHDHISTGQKDCKFGVPLVEVESAIVRIKKSMNMIYKGMHYHIGSQLMENEYHITAAKKAAKLIENVKQHLDLDTEILNIGGGFGIGYLDSRETVCFEDFISGIMEAINTLFEESNLKRPEIFIEPGRWVAGEAGITLYSVGVIKEIPGARTYVSVDGGMPDNIRPSLYQAEYNAVVANKCDEKADTVVSIAGKCCETGDILINDISLPRMERGDFLAVLSTGAYSYSMSSNYNRIPRPAVVFIKDGQDELAVKRESYEDLLRLDTN